MDLQLIGCEHMDWIHLGVGVFEHCSELWDTLEVKNFVSEFYYLNPRTVFNLTF